MSVDASLRRSSGVMLARVGRLDWAFIRRSTTWVVPAGFVAMTLAVIGKYLVTPTWLGFDASLYAAASAAWLAGSDPWAVSQAGIYYAAPPPTLLVFMPFASLPPLTVSVIWILGSFALAGLAIRSLRLPIWWMAFPPLVDAALVGNPDAAVLALLVVGGGRLGALAPFFKIYAVVPMIGERRWRQVGLTGALLTATAFVLPWATWFADLPVITANLASTAAFQTTSVYGSPNLMAIAIVVLLAMGMRRAGWLAVPLLWPSTQFHYMAIAVPGLTPYLALAWCIPMPEARLAATGAFVIYQRVVSRDRAPLGLANHDDGAEAVSSSG